MNNLQTLLGPFSAVSTPIFASKYSLASSRRDLQDLHAFAPLRPYYFRKFSSNFFSSNSDLTISENFRRIFVERRPYYFRTFSSYSTKTIYYNFGRGLDSRFKLVTYHFCRVCKSDKRQCVVIYEHLTLRYSEERARCICRYSLRFS